MKKKIFGGALLLALIGGGLALLLPRVDAQQYPAQETEIAQWRRELNQKLENLSSELSGIRKEMFSESWQRELDKKLENLSHNLSEIKKKLVRMDRKLDDLERLIKQ